MARTYLAEHVPSTTGETPPVGKDDEREILTTVEVLNGLSRLESRVGVPHLIAL